MAYVVLAVIGIPLFAFVFAATVKFLGLFWLRFKTEGPGGFLQLWTQFLVVSTVYVALACFGIGGLLGLILGLAVMAAAYKAVFGAGWVEALVIGILGGGVGWVLLIVILLGMEGVGLPLGG